DGFLAGTQQLAAARAETPGALEDLLVLPFAVRTALLTRHGSSLYPTFLLLKHDPDALGVVVAVERAPAAHLTAALGLLARHDVPLPGGAELHLAGRGHLEALLRALVRLLLRHSSLPSFLLGPAAPRPPGAQPHFLDLLNVLLRLRLILFLLLLVFVLAVIEQLADRRTGLGGHFHEVEAALARDLQRLQGAHLAQHGSVLVHHFHPRNADA